MNHRKRAMTLIMSAILILTILLVPGCGRGLPQDETTYETYTASSQQSQPSPVSLSEDDPKVLEARAAFEQFCDDLFKNQLSDDFLSLHYSLADPASYGLGDCPRTFGEFSLQGLKESAKLQKEQQAALASIPEEFLTQDQQLTYRVLEASFEAEEAFEGLELYYQPLAPTVGIQAQLPVLLAEYIFYSAQDVEDYLALLSTIDSYYQQLLEFEQEKSRAGLFMTLSPRTARPTCCRRKTIFSPPHLTSGSMPWQTLRTRRRRTSKPGILRFCPSTLSLPMSFC